MVKVEDDTLDGYLWALWGSPAKAVKTAQTPRADTKATGLLEVPSQVSQCQEESVNLQVGRCSESVPSQPKDSFRTLIRRHLALRPS